MHPVAIFAIVLGGAVICWGGYEAINTLYEWHNDRKEQREYEEYIRMHTEKGRYIPVTVFQNEKGEEEDDDDDDEPLAIWKQKRDSLNSQSELRHRVNTSQYDEFETTSMASPNYRLSEMERSISARRSMIEKENELLLKEEAELERKREILRSKGNSITGVVQEEDDINPFSDPKPNTTKQHMHSSSDLESWSDLNEFTQSPRMKKSGSIESFESIHHNQL